VQVFALLFEVQHAVDHAPGVFGVVGQAPNGFSGIEFDAFVALLEQVVKGNVVLARNDYRFVKRQGRFAPNPSVGGIDADIQQFRQFLGPLNALGKARSRVLQKLYLCAPVHSAKLTKSWPIPKPP
jgi:hypothetical protein